MRTLAGRAAAARIARIVQATPNTTRGNFVITLANQPSRESPMAPPPGGGSGICRSREPDLHWPSPNGNCFGETLRGAQRYRPRANQASPSGFTKPLSGSVRNT